MVCLIQTNHTSQTNKQNSCCTNVTIGLIHSELHNDRSDHPHLHIGAGVHSDEHDHLSSLNQTTKASERSAQQLGFKKTLYEQ